VKASGNPRGPAPAAAALILALAAAGCSLDYRETQAEEALAENIPDTVLYDVTHRVVKESRLAVSFEAQKVENYSKRKQTLLESVRFTEYGDEGKALTEGQAGSVVYHTDTENAEMSGSVSVRSYKEKATVATGSLSWLKDKRLLTGDPDETVTLEKEDGSYVSGRGFQGDFRAKTMHFTGPVVGTFVYKDEDEEKEK
jgi:LPS export ABC transporter protein LptC